MQPTVVFGEWGGNNLYADGSGYLDDDVAYASRARTDPVSPTGVRGECIFPTIFFAVTHTMAVDITVTPVVDGVELEPRTVSLAAKAKRTLERVQLALSVPILDTAGVERGRVAPRGVWFQIDVADQGLADGELIYEESEVEYDPVSEEATIVTD